MFDDPLRCKINRPMDAMDDNEYKALEDALVARFLGTLPKDDADRDELLSSFRSYLSDQREQLSKTFLAGASEMIMGARAATARRGAH